MNNQRYNFVLTNAGRALYNKCLADNVSLGFVCAKTGDGVHSGSEELSDVTGLTNVKQSFQINSITADETMVRLKFVISNLNLDNGYTLTECGIYGKADNEAEEVLFAIGIPIEPISIPGTLDAGYYKVSEVCEFIIATSNTDAISLELPELAYLLKDEYEKDQKLISDNLHRIIGKTLSYAEMDLGVSDICTGGTEFSGQKVLKSDVVGNGIKIVSAGVFEVTEIGDYSLDVEYELQDKDAKLFVQVVFIDSDGNSTTLYLGDDKIGDQKMELHLLIPKIGNISVNLVFRYNTVILTTSTKMLSSKYALFLLNQKDNESVCVNGISEGRKWKRKTLIFENAEFAYGDGGGHAPSGKSFGFLLNDYVSEKIFDATVVSFSSPYRSLQSAWTEHNKVILLKCAPTPLDKEVWNITFADESAGTENNQLYLAVDVLYKVCE